MTETVSKLIFEKLEHRDEGTTLAEEYTLPVEFQVEELEEINELRRLSLALRQPDVEYFTGT